MNRSLTRALGLALAIAALPTLASAQGGEWTTLFDGSSLDGWRVLGDANWALADAAVDALAEALRTDIAAPSRATIGR